MEGGRIIAFVYYFSVKKNTETIDMLYDIFQLKQMLAPVENPFESFKLYYLEIGTKGYYELLIS